MNKKPKILVADDERDIADAIGIILRYSDMESYVVYDGISAYEAARQYVFDGMILDIMMPGMDGITLLSRLREEGDVTPIMMLTAKSQVEDRIQGLQEGADDYLPKPFDKGELVTRLQVMIRRRRQYDGQYVTVGNTRLDREGLEITNVDHSLRLSGKEVELLSFLMQQEGKWVEESQIIERVWPQDDCEPGTVNLYVGYLTNKLLAIQSDIEIARREDHQFSLRKKG